MTVHVLEREQFIARSVERVFSFFSEAQNLQRITPPWLGFELLTPAPIEMREGTLIEYRLRVHRLPLTWVSRIESWEYNRAFVDRQIHGPYQLWHHTHEFEGIAPARSCATGVLCDPVRDDRRFSPAVVRPA